ncbi:MAG: tRNA-binding protein [Planctomycetota bacterium]
MPASFEDFQNLNLRVGRVTSVRLNEKARVPALVLEIDFGPEGTRISSAQLTQNYDEKSLLDRQVVCVMGFEPKRVAGVKSEVLVLGVIHPERGTLLLQVDGEVPDGEPVA